MTRSQAESFISYSKYDEGKLELVVSVHLDDLLIAGRPETLESIKELIKLKFNIQESGKVKKFIGVLNVKLQLDKLLNTFQCLRHS